MNLETTAEQFHRDGFAIVQGIFSRAEIEQIDRELSEFIRTVAPTMDVGRVFYEDGPTRPIKSIHGMESRSPFFHGLMEDDRLLRLVRAIWPGDQLEYEAVMLFCKAARDGSEAPPHQDNTFQCWQPPLALTLTIAIDESTPENGVLTCQRRTHKLGLLPHRQSGVMGFSRRLVEVLGTGEFPEVQLSMKPGDVALHHINTVHYSGPNRTDRARRQLGIGYRSSRAKRDEHLFQQYQSDLQKLYAADAVSR